MFVLINGVYYEWSILINLIFCIWSWEIDYVLRFERELNIFVVLDLLVGNDDVWGNYEGLL